MAPKLGRILKSPFTGIKSAMQGMFPRGGWGVFSLPRSGFNYERTVGSGLGSSVIVAPLRWLQRNFTEPPVRLRQANGDDWDAVNPDHPFLQLVSRPNDYYTGSTLWKATVASYELDGNAYWMIAHNNQGRPVQAWWVPHTLLEPKREDGSANFIDYYEYTPGDGRTLHIAPIGHDRSGMAVEPGWSVVAFRDGIDPDNTMKGSSGFRSLLREVFTDDEAANFTASLLRNMGVPGLIISPSDDGMMAPIGDEDVRETKAMVKAATTGDARGEPIVMTGPTKIETIGFNPQQLNLRDLRKIPEERCTAVIGIPAIVCGLGAGLDRSTFSNMQEAKESAYDDKVLPLQRDMADTLWSQLLPQFETVPSRFKVDFDNSEVRALREDEDKMATRVASLVTNGIITVAEARDKLGEPVDDTHQIYLRPLSLIETPATPTPAEEDTPSDRTLEYRLGSAVSAGLMTVNEAREQLGLPPVATGNELVTAADAPQAAEPKGAKRLSRAAQRRIITAFALDQRSLESAFAKRLEKQFKDLGKQAGDIWRDIAPPDPAPIDAPKATDDERAIAERRAAAGLLSEAQLIAAGKLLQKLDINTWQSTVLAKEYAGHYEQVALKTFGTLADNAGIVLNAPDPVAEQIIRTGGKRVGMVYLDSQTKAAVYSAIADARAEGLGVQAVERKIREYVEAGGRGRNVSARAMRIARTETLHAQRMSAIAAYEGSGAYSTLIAFDNLLGHDDEDCMERDGTEYTFAEAEAEAENEHPNGTLNFAPGEAV